MVTFMIETHCTKCNMKNTKVFSSMSNLKSTTIIDFKCPHYNCLVRSTTKTGWLLGANAKIICEMELEGEAQESLVFGSWGWPDGNMTQKQIENFVIIYGEPYKWWESADLVIKSADLLALKYHQNQQPVEIVDPILNLMKIFF
jgi:hypothetical protein